MEKTPLSRIDQLNLQFVWALDNWQKFPGNRIAVEMVGSLIDEGYKLGTLQFGIEDAVLKKAEGSRAILSSDLKRLAQRIGDVWIFNFKPNSAGGRFKIDAINNYLRIKDASYGEMVPAAHFEPREIAMIAVK